MNKTREIKTSSITILLPAHGDGRMVGALGFGAGFVGSVRNHVIFHDAHKLQLCGLENKNKKNFTASVEIRFRNFSLTDRVHFAKS